MTVVAAGTPTTEPDKVRLNKYRISYVETSGAAKVVETKGSLQVSKSENLPSQRRDRVFPEGGKMVSRKSSKKAVEGEDATPNSDVGSSRKIRQKGAKPSLRIDTRTSSGSWSKSDDDTPRTVASTPSSSTPSGLRGKRDLRSPGIRKSPTAQSAESAPIPDFITQTDRYGNASTPRSATAMVSAQSKNNSLTPSNQKIYQVEVDPCETLLDSIRLMCCCLLPEESHAYNTKDKDEEQHTDGSDDPSNVYEDRVRLLPKIHPDDQGKKCLVLDLDETLVHSSFRAVPGADFVIPVQIEDVVHFVYVAKRPGVDEFLIEMAKHYEIVIYTASLNKYADPLLDLLDPNRVIRARLFRESCVYYEGNYVKDMSLIDRDLSQAIIVDNSPSSYIFHPENAIDCSSFIDDPEDRELDQIGAFLKGIRNVKDVRGYCSKWREWPNVDLEDDQLGSSQ